MRNAGVFGSLATLLTLAGMAPASGARSSTAEQVIEKTGVSAGLAVVVGTTDGKLVAGLTNGGRMLVQGLALTDEAAEEARKHILAKRLYGLASVVRIESGRTLPYFDRLVNLLVADLDALGGRAPSMAEMMRVLGYEGVVWLKRDGKWSRTVKPTPQDVDSWTHYHYDASGNPVCKDLVVGPPNTFRWVDGPFGMNLIGGFRTSDGVAVQINPTYLLMKSRPRIPDELRGLHLWARDVNSGVLLWRRQIVPPNARYRYAREHTETFVAAGGGVYAYDFTDDERVALTCWDIRTGKVRRVFQRGVVCRKADWPGGPDKRADWREWANKAFAWSTVLVRDGKVVQMVRDKLLVMDLGSGRVIWRKQTGDDTQYTKVVVSGDRLVTLRARIESDRRERKLNLASAEAWRLNDAAPLWRIDLTGLTYPSAAEGNYHQNLAAREPYLLLPLADNRAILLDARDGSRVWEKPSNGRFGHLIIGDRIFMDHAGSNPFGGVIMLATGERDPTPRKGGMNQSACDAATGTPKWFMGKRNFVPVDRRPGWPHWVSLRCMGKKCGERAAASYGSIYGVSPMCGCDQFIRGSGAFYAVKPVAPVADQRRLSRGGGGALGPVEPQVEATKALSATFWGMPEGLPGFWFTTNFRWSEPIHHWPGYGRTQTKPVQADALTLVAHVHEHRLAAMREGKEVWNFIAGGRIGAPPVVFGHLAIFASHDGCVYAVNVADGRLVWRLLAAPADRRHVVLGQVESGWPVFNVVLRDDLVYCSAGRHEEMDGGIHFYCLDAATGAVRWHVKRRCGLESDLEPIRQRKNTGDDRGRERLKRGILSDGRAQMNDVIELRDGHLCLHGVPMVDVSDPKDTIKYPRTLVPPQIAAPPEAAPAAPDSGRSGT